MEDEKSYCIFDATENRVIKLKENINLLSVLEILRGNQILIYDNEYEGLGVTRHAKCAAERLKFSECDEYTIINSNVYDNFLKRLPAKLRKNITYITDTVVDLFCGMLYDPITRIDPSLNFQYLMDRLNVYCNTATNFTWEWRDRWYDEDIILYNSGNIVDLAETLVHYQSSWGYNDEHKEKVEALELLSKYKVLKDNNKLFKEAIVNEKTISVVAVKEKKVKAMELF